MAKGIKKSERVPEIAPVSLGELIHAQVRGAIEAAVHEKLAAALEAAPYERSGTRRGDRNGVKRRTLTGPTGPLALTLPGGRSSGRRASRNGPRRSCRATSAGCERSTKRW